MTLAARWSVFALAVSDHVRFARVADRTQNGLNGPAHPCRTRASAGRLPQRHIPRIRLLRSMRMSGFGVRTGSIVGAGQDTRSNLLRI